MTHLCIIPMDDLAERGIKYSRSQIYRKIKEGSFPQPVRLGGNRIGFIESEITRWIESLITARDAGTNAVKSNRSPLARLECRARAASTSPEAA